MNNKSKSLLKNLLLALAVTPMVSFVGVIVITLMGALDDAITKIQSMGYWWVILIAAYILSLIYVFYEPTFRQNREKEKMVDALVLYWKEQLIKNNKPQPSDYETKLVREKFLKRVEIWVWFGPEMWGVYFPDEKYPKYLFDIVDNFIPYWENLKTSVNTSKN